MRRIYKEDNYGYSKAIENVLKEDKCLVWGYIRGENKQLIAIPSVINSLIFDFYLGIVKEHEDKFKSELKNDYEKSDTNICRDYNFFHKNNLNTIFSDCSFKNLLACNNDFTRIIKLHRSGFFEIPQKFYLLFPTKFMYAYKSFPFITRYLLENTKECDTSCYLKLILFNYCKYCNIMDPWFYNDELKKFIKNAPYIITISVIYSKNCYEKTGWLADELYKLDVCHSDYTRNIVKTLRKIYFGN